MRFSASRLMPFLLLLPVAAGSCSDSSAPTEPLAALPTERELPHRFNQDCACVRDGHCAVLEEQPGVFEVRHLNCRWTRGKVEAECSFEESFTAHHHGADGNYFGDAGEWKGRSLRAKLLPDVGWCAL